MVQRLCFWCCDYRGESFVTLCAEGEISLGWLQSSCWPEGGELMWECLVCTRRRNRAVLRVRDGAVNKGTTQPSALP